MKDLFSGIAVVIDDEVNDTTANIGKIINQIESANIPVLKYTAIPSEEVIRHFQNLSFLLLDWRLIKKEVTNEEIKEGVTIPDTLQEYDVSENIAFIKNLNKVCFCPIFIFTNEDVTSIQTSLSSGLSLSEDKPSNLFVQPKSDLQNEDTLFNKITEWLKYSPSIYVLKEWEKEYQSCKNRLFLEFHDLSSEWPYIMWKNFEDDGANKSLELGELISRNLHSRMTPFEFNNDILNKDNSTIAKKELRKVLEGERYLKKDSLHDSDIGTGDLFKEKYKGNGEIKYRYYLNIRAQCDLLREEAPKLYTISGEVLEQNKNGKITNISFNQGQYLEKPNHAVIAFLDEGKILEFKFSGFEIKDWKELKDSRIGRLLPPYINKIQQRYALYMQRQGLPRIPDAAIFNSSSPSEEG